MTNPKVSVIIPNYNHAPYLRQRLDSIFNQTFQDFEVIILDDCSTDNSKEIIEEYRSKPQISHIVYNETNSGSPFKQWAKGFELAQGEFIWIAESDDWAEPTFLNESVDALQSHPNAVLVFCDSIWSYKDKDVKKTISTHNFSMSSLPFLKKYMVAVNSICNASGALFQKKNLNHISSSYQTYKGCGDWHFWIETCSLGNICYIAKPLNHFRQHEFSTTVKQRTSGTAFFELLRIFRFQKSKKMVSPYMKLCTPVISINYIKEHKRFFLNSPSTYKEIISEWKKEAFFFPLSKLIVSTIYYVWKTQKFIKEKSSKFIFKKNQV